MAAFKIDQGGVYANANEVFAREVIVVTPDGDVIYNDYGLSDGAPIGRQRRCSLGTFVQWAARPLTSEEIRALRRDEGESRDMDMLKTVAKLATEAASDELIRREFYRRGLDRLPAPDKPPSPAGSEDSPEADIERTPSRHTGRSKKRGNGRRKSAS